MYICICAGKTKSDVKIAIQGGITDMDILMKEIGVGTGCGTCYSYLKEMIAKEIMLSS